jgi:plasmid stabilization system protein ParE
VPANYRLAGPAEDQIDRILLESARKWGVEAAARYHRLILAAMSAVGDTPTRPGARAVSRVTGGFSRSGWVGDS